MSRPQDPFESLKPLRDLSWNDDASRRETRGRILLRVPSARSRKRYLARIAAAVLASAVLGGGFIASGGVDAVRKVFGIEIIDVETDSDGEVRQLMIETDTGQKAVLVPLDRSPLVQGAPVDTRRQVRWEDGSNAVLHLTRRGRAFHDDLLMTVEDVEATLVGQRLTVRRLTIIRRTIARQGPDILLTAWSDTGEAVEFIFHPDDAAPRRFTDGTTVFEILES